MRPLEGIRVLDFTRVLAGPHATRMLCDLGAEVIKVEPPVGDLTRFGQPRLNSLATYFIQQNVGKLNVSLNFDDERAIDLARRLADVSDIVIENFRPGVMARLGLDYETLSVSNSRLIYASISGYGATGPWVDRRAYAPVVNAEAGLTKHQGDVRGGVYANDPFSHGDVYTGMETAAALLAALVQRDRTGRGQFIDVSMAETLLYVNEHAHDQLWQGDVPSDWIRSFQPADYPVLTTRDGSVVVVSGHPASKTNFAWFCAAMGRADLADDPRFIDVPARLAHLPEFHAIFRPGLRPWRTLKKLNASLPITIWQPVACAAWPSSPTPTGRASVVPSPRCRIELGARCVCRKARGSSATPTCAFAGCRSIAVKTTSWCYARFSVLMPTRSRSYSAMALRAVTAQRSNSD